MTDSSRGGRSHPPRADSAAAARAGSLTSYPAPDEAIGDLLDQIAEQLSFPVPAHLRAAPCAVPRHLFLPPTLWSRDGNGGYQPCDRESAPDRWWRAAYRDVPLVTRFAEGPDGDRVPSSSASMPSPSLGWSRL
ncbi:hypothetical protein [Streptomyces sp. NEAU-L66]|uniref:hypothetical protein n=1 Tax=Streptomyces sp. NEAU-L66 TaxID=3390812 RepID=UPI0039C6D335